MKFCRKEKQDCCQTEAGGKKGLCLLKGMAVAMAVSCIFFIAYGIVLTYTSLAESTIPIVARVVRHYPQALPVLTGQNASNAAGSSGGFWQGWYTVFCCG